MKREAIVAQGRVGLYQFLEEVELVEVVVLFFFSYVGHLLDGHLALAWILQFFAYVQVKQM